MAYTFFYTTETEQGPTAIKFESRSRSITEFHVTILNHDIEPFKMELSKGEWIPIQLPEQLKNIEREIADMAKKFQR